MKIGSNPYITSYEPAENTKTGKNHIWIPLSLLSAFTLEMDKIHLKFQFICLPSQ